MKKTIELRKPLLINGTNVTELTYDFEEISCDAFSMAFSYASAKSFSANQQGKQNAALMEQDTNFHMYLGMQAIIAVNPEIDMADLERIKGYDLVKIAGLGRNFIYGKSEEPSAPSSLEEPSEVIPESTTQELEKSKEEALLDS